MDIERSQRIGTLVEKIKSELNDESAKFVNPARPEVKAINRCCDHLDEIVMTVSLLSLIG